MLWEGLISCKIIFLETLKLADFRREGSSLFYSRIVDDKNTFLEKLSLKLKEGMLAKWFV